MKCVFTGCDQVGPPIEGYGFFACEACLERCATVADEYASAVAEEVRAVVSAR